MMNAKEFKLKTGHEPEQDDLERVNCDQVGTLGHLCCGWNRERDKPQFEVGPLPWNGKFPYSSDRAS